MINEEEDIEQPANDKSSGKIKSSELPPSQVVVDNENAQKSTQKSTIDDPIKNALNDSQPKVQIKNRKNYKFTLRKFEYPICLQDESKKEMFKNRFESCKEENTKHPFHFSLHYSTSAYTIVYLSRFSPFTESQICLQNGKFDSPNRQLFNITELLKILFANDDNGN